jgi:NADPH-dependent curcumin reductase CurA
VLVAVDHQLLVSSKTGTAGFEVIDVGRPSLCTVIGVVASSPKVES